MQLEKGMFIISVDVDVGSRELGVLNKGKNDESIIRCVHTHFFGVTIGDPRWNAAVDINVDGTIDIYDIVLIVGDFEETA